MNDKTYARITRIFFVLNAAFLTWAILWKCGVPFIGDSSQRVINLVPFQGDTRLEMEFNVLLFVPYGFLLSVFMTKGFRWRLLAVVLTSAFMEITQYILAVGRSDITDILLNTLGGIFGIVACYLLAKLLGKYSRIAVMIACVFIIAFELYVSVSFILYGVVRFGSVMFRL